MTGRRGAGGCDPRDARDAEDARGRGGRESGLCSRTSLTRSAGWASRARRVCALPRGHPRVTRLGFRVRDSPTSTNQNERRGALEARGRRGESRPSRREKRKSEHEQTVRSESPKKCHIFKKNRVTTSSGVHESSSEESDATPPPIHDSFFTWLSPIPSPSPPPRRTRWSSPPRRRASTRAPCTSSSAPSLSVRLPR